MKNSVLLASSIFFVSSLIAQKKYDYDFQNPSLSIEKRVTDLVSRLTLEEKVSQMLNATPAIERLGIPAMIGGMNVCMELQGRNLKRRLTRRQLPWLQHSMPGL